MEFFKDNCNDHQLRSPECREVGLINDRRLGSQDYLWPVEFSIARKCFVSMFPTMRKFDVFRKLIHDLLDDP